MNAVIDWFASLTGRDILMGCAAVATVAFLFEIAGWLLHMITGKRN